MKSYFSFNLSGFIFRPRGGTITLGALTLLELANRKDPDGAQAKIAEILTMENEILIDAIWLEANNTTHHQVTRRYSLPTGAWRQLNSGVPTEASRTIVANEPIGMLESYSEPDKKLVDMAPNPKGFRMSEASSFIEGMSQTLADTVMYGNHLTDVEQFTGLSPRMASLAITNNVLNNGTASGSTNTSVFIVQWGDNKVFMTYPKGIPSNGIVKHEDLGVHTILDAADTTHLKKFQAYRDHFEINAGLVVKDPRCIGRICNISTATALDEDYLITLLNRMPQSGRGAKIYVNTRVKTQMEIALKDKANVFYTAKKGEGLAGEEVLYFRGNAIRKVEAIIDTEPTYA